MIPEQSGLGRAAVESQHVDHRVEPPLVVARVFAEMLVGLELLGGSVHIAADGAALAQLQLGRGQIRLG